MNSYITRLDLSSFWEDSAHAREHYIGSFPSQDIIRDVEQDLGYKLPQSYIALMLRQNGGIPVNNCFPTNTRTSWAENHVAITGIMGIGREKTYSLCGELGSKFMMEEWGYPDIGIYFCDCPSAGHDMICLDYRNCGASGEPQVVHVDQEDNYKVTFLANSFTGFIKGLVHESQFD